MQRLREFLARRCKDNDFWRGHEQLGTREFLERTRRGAAPYEEGTLFFYLDEYAKDAPKDLLAVLTATGEWLTNALRSSTLVEEHRRPSGLLQLNKAERALLLYGTLARYQRDLRSILVEFKVNNAPEAYAAIADIAGVSATDVGEGPARRLAAGAHWPGGKPHFRTQHHRPGRPDEGERKAPAGADARVPRPERADGGVHPPVGKSPLGLDDFSFVGTTRRCCALLRNAVERKEPGVNVLLYGPPGTGKDRAGLRWWPRPPGWSCLKWNTPTGMATR